MSRDTDLYPGAVFWLFCMLRAPAHALLPPALAAIVLPPPPSPPPPTQVVASFYGGVAAGPQMRSLMNGVDVAVGTPGRIKQLANEKALNLGTVRHFVIDECDKVLEKLGEPS